MEFLRPTGLLSHSDSNTSEQPVGRSKVAGLTPLFKATLPDIAEGQPMILTGVTTPNASGALR